MPVRFSSETGLRAAVSVTQMVKMLGLSRAAFYDHIRRGNFLPPVYSIRTRRPLFTAEMQRQNLEVKVRQVGINGDFVLFYDRLPRTDRNEVERSTQGRPGRSSSLAAGLRERLYGLGLENLTERRVQEALNACFPAGINGTPEADVLRIVYRSLRSDPAR